MQNKVPAYSWAVLSLTALTSLIGLGTCFTGLAPLFTEIAEDLGLDLMQLGAIWGMAPLATVISAFPGGMLIDRFGIRRVIGLGFILTAVFAGLRGVAGGLPSLVAISLLFGVSYAITFAGIPKVIRMLFPSRMLGLSQGINAAAFCAGSALAVMVSGSLTSLLGGWRNIMFLYAAILLILSVFWILLVREKKMVEIMYGYGETTAPAAGVTFKESFSKVVRNKQVWLIALALLGMIGTNFPIVGYLPTFFENAGMTRAEAASLGSLALWGFGLGNFLIPVLSDRIGLRKAVAWPSAFLGGLSAFLIPVLAGGPVWLAVFGIGLFSGGVFPLLFIIPIESKSVGAIYAGAAVGLVTSVGQLGGFLGPIIGGALAGTDPASPFLFWASLTLLPLVCLLLVKETGLRSATR